MVNTNKKTYIDPAKMVEGKEYWFDNWDNTAVVIHKKVGETIETFNYYLQGKNDKAIIRRTFEEYTREFV